MMVGDGDAVMHEDEGKETDDEDENEDEDEDEDVKDCRLGEEEWMMWEDEWCW